MAMKPTLIHLEPEQLARLDELGEVLSVSRSALIRTAIDDMLTRASENRSDADAYDRMPLDTPDEWGNLADWLEAARAARSK
jgi:predicted DNA-binding protein